MAVINTGLLTASLRGEFLNRFDAVETLYQLLSTRIPSTTAQENYRWLGTVPQMREWGTGRLAKGLRGESYDVTNNKYESTIEVDRDEINDDQLGQIRIRVAELAQRAATHKDKMIGSLLENGASSGYNSYDGVTFFNAAHVSGDSGNQDNDLAPTMAGAAPTTAEFKAGLASAIAAMLAFKDDQGEPMAINQGGLAVIVPPALLFTALEAVNASVISQTTNVMQGVAQVIPCSYLTASAVTAFLCKTDGIVRPFIFQDREPIEFTSLAEGSEEDFNREKFLYGVRARYRMTYGYWQYCVRMVFT